MESIRNSFFGKEQLWKVFWLYGVLGAIMIGVGIAVLIATLGSVGNFVSGAVIIVYNIWITVSLWRCAFNCGWQGWGYIIRAILVVAVLGFILEILGVVPVGA